MAISHKDHDHPNTPAARAACRRRLILDNIATKPASGDMTLNLRTGEIKPAPIGRVITAEDEARLAEGLVDGVHPGRTRKAAQLNVVPRKRGDGGVVRGMQATAPKVAERRMKVTGTRIKSEHDLADVPALLADVIREAWSMDWDVQAGHPFNELERRVVITGRQAEIALVWNAEGTVGYFVRNWNSSVTFRVQTPADAFHAADVKARWTAQGNLVQVTGKRK